MYLPPNKARSKHNIDPKCSSM